ncbi:MAG: hypothetical protein H6622_00470 [Halobacteriovoraceae bacterium]|nr:hypothetical protein [Halobacteriovoraceae bacterium]
MQIQKKHFILLIFNIYVSSAVCANYIHIISKGETFSQIVLRYFPNPEFTIYGHKGMIEYVKKLNPQLKNIEKIKAGENVILPIYEEGLIKYIELGIIENILEQSRKENELKKKIQDKIPTTKWGLSLLYGYNFYSMDQSGSMGTVKFGSNNPLHIGSSFFYHLDNFKLINDIRYTNFEYVSKSGSNNKDLFEVSLYFFYKNFGVAHEMKQKPLFNIRTNGSFSIQILSLYSPGLIFEKNISDLWFMRNQYLSIFIGIPVYASADDTIKDINGFGLHGKWSFSPIKKWPSFEFVNQIYYSYNDIVVLRDNVNKSVKNANFEYILGLQYEF